MSRRSSLGSTQATELIRIAQVRKHGRASSAPKKSVLPPRSGLHQKRSQSPTNSADRILAIISTLQKTASLLPIATRKIRELSDTLNNLRQIGTRSSRCVARNTNDFWTTWNNLKEMVESSTSVLTPTRSETICSNQLVKFSQNLTTLEKHAPIDESHKKEFVSSLDKLKHAFEELKTSTTSVFSNISDEDKIVSESRALIKPYQRFLDAISTEHSSVFQKAVITVPDSNNLRSGCVHAIELILETIRGLRERVSMRKRIMKELAESESELITILPPNQRRLAFQPASPVRQLKGEIKKVNDSVKDLKRELTKAEKNEGEEIEQLKNRLTELEVASHIDLKKQCEALQTERDELVTKISKAKERLSNLQTEENKKAPVNPNENVDALIQEGNRLKERLVHLRAEYRRLEEDVIRAKASNAVLSKGANEYKVNAELRDEKLDLLAEIQNTREEILALRSFKTRAHQMNIIPSEEKMTKQQIMSEYQSAMASNAAVMKERKAVLESVSSLRKRHNQLLYDTTVAEIAARSDPSDEADKSILEELEAATKAYNEERRKCLEKQHKLQLDMALVRRHETDRQIMRLRTRDGDTNVQKEIGIINKEIRENEETNNEMLLWISEMQRGIVEAKAKSLACQRQIDIMNSKLKNPNTNVELVMKRALDEACEENKRLKLQLEHAKLQLKELDECIGNAPNDDITVEKRLQAIAMALT